MKAEDVSAVADIHARAMPHALLAGAGKRFVADTLLQFVIESEDAVAHVIEKDGAVLGFSIFDKSPNTISKHLDSCKLKFVRALFSKGPTGIALLIRTLVARFGVRVEWDSCIDEPCFHLFVIAVDPQVHGQGVGGALFDVSCRAAASHFGLENCLVEARTQQAVRFYSKLGFSTVGREFRGRTVYYKLLKKVSV